MNYRKDLYPGVVLGLFSMVYLLGSLQIPEFNGNGATPLTNRFMPQFWGFFLLVLSALLVIRGIRARKVERAACGQVEKINVGQALRNNREVIFTFVALTLYIAGLQTIGFTVMSALYIFAANLILTNPSKLNKKHLLCSAVFAVVVAVVIDFLFVQFLHVLLPTGILGF